MEARFRFCEVILLGSNVMDIEGTMSAKHVTAKRFVPEITSCDHSTILFGSY